MKEPHYSHAPRGTVVCVVSGVAERTPTPRLEQCALSPATTPPFSFSRLLLDSAGNPAKQEGCCYGQGPCPGAHTHRRRRAHHLAKDLDALRAALGDMQHAVEQMRARVQSLDDRMIRVGNDVAAQRAALEQLTHSSEERDVSAASESPRRTPMALFEAFLRTCPPERISAGYASWDFDRAMHAIADTWALDQEQLRATLALWREHKLIATDGPDTFRKRLRIGKSKATYPLCVPIASYPLVGIEMPPSPRPHTVSADSKS